VRKIEFPNFGGGENFQNEMGLDSNVKKVKKTSTNVMMLAALVM